VRLADGGAPLVGSTFTESMHALDDNDVVSVSAR
jgi:hypothetical protein